MEYILDNSTIVLKGDDPPDLTYIIPGDKIQALIEEADGNQD